MTARTPAPCEHWDGPAGRHCRSAAGVRFFLTGWCCPAHTPSALAGRPEPPPGPGRLPGAWTTPTPDAVAHVIDERAIASGKRRSTPNAYRAAQAATRKDT
jgi:hypothetical protein